MPLPLQIVDDFRTKLQTQFTLEKPERIRQLFLATRPFAPAAQFAATHLATER